MRQGMLQLNAAAVCNKLRKNPECAGPGLNAFVAWRFFSTA